LNTPYHEGAARLPQLQVLGRLRLQAAHVDPDPAVFAAALVMKSSMDRWRC